MGTEVITEIAIPSAQLSCKPETALNSIIHRKEERGGGRKGVMEEGREGARSIIM